ncbi:hypothetical protein LTR66_002409 [Elasticomyces elasticus]|nr:hypothetical protein LTR66_002409 [Elasticomyces elasticus]
MSTTSAARPTSQRPPHAPNFHFPPSVAQTSQQCPQNYYGLSGYTRAMLVPGLEQRVLQPRILDTKLNALGKKLESLDEKVVNLGKKLIKLERSFRDASKTLAQTQVEQSNTTLSEVDDKFALVV